LIFFITGWLLIPIAGEVNSSPPTLRPLSVYRKMSRIKDPVLLRRKLEENVMMFEEEKLVKPAILFKLMLAESYQGSGNFIVAEKIFISAYENVKMNLPAKKEKYYLIGRTT